MPTTEIEAPLIEMFRHNRWANLRLLEFCRDLTAEQLAATTTGTFGSIHRTLLHLVRGEGGYIRLLTGQPPAPRLPDEPPPTIAQMYEQSALFGAMLIDLAGPVRSEDIVPNEEDGRIYQIPAARLLIQVINHATEHRAQIATILTQIGLTPPEMDGWAYMDDMGMVSHPV